MILPMGAEDNWGPDRAPAAVTEPAEAVVVCGDKFFSCRCDLPPGHDGPHVCGRDNGSWRYDEYGDSRVVAFPDVLKGLDTTEQ